MVRLPWLDHAPGPVLEPQPAWRRRKQRSASSAGAGLGGEPADGLEGAARTAQLAVWA